ncbi:DUF421 domain-containing protein [Deinococcus cellulosilyticus]|uniref:DUF421 domain-containing protein n=1 Tax=Deinococcus cellulosilyticus (strain DSM 18568 / NBRC 106333 / KACC 11606 / 5516J-15) TaxID=1223518 RepID=A0A511NBR3_DEIC1|nr:YetF domain-containing protein [Deinococcus cellulosilyticus]GEM49938.1 DUF421 domain-containing protein [Deinococcus cellulosilyticus NBRC 106333 = KACC 11606]
MEAVVRAATLYFILMIIFRLTGKRTMSQVTTFDMVVLLVISETVQNFLVDEDHSFTHMVLLVITLLGLDVLLSMVKQKFPGVEKWMDGVPVILVEDGKPLEDRMKKSRVDVSDILEAARQTQGLERMDQIKYAILERAGAISIVPKEKP